MKEYLALAGYVVAFFAGQFAGMFGVLKAVEALGYDMHNETTANVGMGLGVIVGLFIMYVLGNAFEGKNLKDIFGRLGIYGAITIIFAAVLVLGAVALWGGFNFVATTPIWALVIIVLLILLLLKK